MLKRIAISLFFVPLASNAAFFTDEAPPASQTKNPPLHITAMPRWTIANGEKLSAVFARWAKESQRWQLVWEAPDRIMENDATLDCPFEEAISQIIEVLNNDGESLVARFYEKNSILRIQEAE